MNKPPCLVVGGVGAANVVTTKSRGVPRWLGGTLLIDEYNVEF